MKIQQTNNDDLYNELISAIAERKDITALLKKVEKRICLLFFIPLDQVLKFLSML